MPRTYELKKRAERRSQTRRRIVEATVELHGEVGPAATTISAIADRAGVQRHTVYAHFPDEGELLMACSGLHLERHPLPDPSALFAIEDGVERLRAAVAALHDYYEAQEPVLANVLRDVERHEPTRAAVEARIAPVMGRISEAVVEGLPARGGAKRRARAAAAVAVALDFGTWRLLRAQGLGRRQAVETAVRMAARQ